MFQFFTLPDAISTSVLADWVTTIELFVLDTSVCNKKSRAQYLKIVQYKSFLSHGLEDHQSFHLSSYFSQLNLRGVKIQNLKIHKHKMQYEKPAIAFIDSVELNLGTHGCGLLNLDVSECFINGYIVRKLGVMFPSLRKINFNKCTFNQTDFLFDTIVDHFTGLQSLSISGCHKLTNDCVSLLVRGCKELHSLDISNCHQLSNDAVLTIVDHIGYQLEKIDISGCSQSIKRSSIERIISGCPRLKYMKCNSFFDLTITKSYITSDNYHETSTAYDNTDYTKQYAVCIAHLPNGRNLIDIINLFPPLSKLKLDGQMADVFTALIELENKMRLLHTLEVTTGSLSFNQVKQLVELYPKLRHIKIHFCKGLTFQAALDLQSSYPIKIQTLKTPDIEFNMQYAKLVIKTRVYDDQLIDLFNRFSALHTVEIYDSKEVCKISMLFICVLTLTIVIIFISLLRQVC
jgi:hypothetical protein